MSKRDDLLARKKAIELELEKLDRVESGIVELSDYTDEQKINFFDKYYNMARMSVKSLEDNGYSDKDEEHWFFEEGMQILNIDDKNALWKYINSLT